MKKVEFVFFGVIVFWGFIFFVMKVSFNYFLLIFFFVYCFGLVLFFMFFIFGRRVLKCEMFKEGFIFGLIFFFGYGF